jgi:hypothetical protein
VCRNTENGSQQRQGLRIDRGGIGDFESVLFVVRPRALHDSKSTKMTKLIMSMTLRMEHVSALARMGLGVGRVSEEGVVLPKLS